MKKYLSILAILSFFLFPDFQCEEKDCCSPNSEDCPASAVLSGTWRLKAYQNVSTGKLETDPDPEGRGIVFTFEEANGKGKITGHTAANEVFGSYFRDRCVLKDVVFGGTKAGEPTTFSSKAWSAITGARQLTLTKDKLSIYFNNSAQIMLFEKAD